MRRIGMSNLKFLRDSIRQNLKDLTHSKEAISSYYVLITIFLSRVVNFVETIVLARYLSPADYGVVSLALLIVGGIISTTDVGLRPAIIHFQNLHDRDVNTAWTISIIKGLILTLCLVVISPYIALFFNSPKLQGMLVILSLVLFIQGFENIWTTKLEVAVSFKCIEFVNQLAWVIGPCVSILIIIFTMTIWGPIIGIITRYSIIVAGSYFYC